MDTIIPFSGEEPLALLRRCGGYYECPENGPLVGYAGRYDVEGGGALQYVGRVYANFAKAERHGPVLSSFAYALHEQLRARAAPTNRRTVFCGAPEGGKALATMLGHFGSCQYVFPEKKVTKVGTDTAREESILRFDRHELEEGDVVWIVEDVCNNFSTTKTMIELIQGFGAEVGGITCFLNRSLDVDGSYRPWEDQDDEFPVVSLVRKRIEQYRQDHPSVAADIKAGNVVWKPKNDWSLLEKAMAAAA